VFLLLALASVAFIADHDHFQWKMY
jgi:hypothetical protein